MMSVTGYDPYVAATLGKKSLVALVVLPTTAVYLFLSINYFTNYYICLKYLQPLYRLEDT